MNNLKLISKNKNLFIEIKKTIEPYFSVLFEKIPDSIDLISGNFDILNSHDTRDIKIIIIDLTSFNAGDLGDSGQSKYFTVYEDPLLSRNKSKIILEKIAKIKLPKIFIINPEIAQIFPQIINNYEDIIFLNRIKEELSLRASLIINRYSTKDPQNLIIVGEMILNLEKYELLVQNETIELTFKEFELLKYLIKNEEKVFSRNTLLSQIWGYDFYGGNRTVDVHMRRVRSKIPYPYDQMLKTVRNVGYMFSKN